MRMAQLKQPISSERLLYEYVIPILTDYDYDKKMQVYFIFCYACEIIVNMNCQHLVLSLL